MIDPLARLLADGIVDEVVGRLKSGKEADLWLVRHGGETIAAKVYKAREARNFRNRSAYQEGRKVRNTRTQRAMDRGSRFGQAAEEDAWKAREADALHALHAAGVRVPKPVLFYEGVLLMELVLDAAGHPAPRLVDAKVGRGEAAALYADLRGQAVRMLASDLIHGDLSPYNVLMGSEGPVVIDFPQAIGAAHNSQAEGFFRRDLEGLRRFLAAVDPALERAAGDAGEIWRAYVRRELTADFVPTGRAPEPPAQRPHRGEGRQAGGPPAHPPRGEHRHPAAGPQRPQHPGRPEHRPQPAGGQRPQHPARAEHRPHPAGGGQPPSPAGPAPAAGRPPRDGNRPAPGDRRNRRDPRGRQGRPGGPAGPEVVRVVRPPLGTQVAAPHGHHGHPPAAGAPPPGGPAQPGRRRRRRRRR